MKKIKSLLVNIFVCIIYCYLFTLNVSADVIHISGLGHFKYDIKENEAIIIFYQLDSIIDTLVIPSEIEGYPTVSIGKKAFIQQQGIKEFTIPKSIKSIGEYALGYIEVLEPVIVEITCVGGYEVKYKYVYKKIEDMVIRGYKGTAAETYAKENGFEFTALDEPKVTTATTQISSTTSTTVSTPLTTTSTQSSTSTSAATTSSVTSTSLITSTTNVSQTTLITSTTATTSTTTTDITANIVGDANNDGKLNIVDAAFIAKRVAQRKTNLLPERADYNMDGNCDMLDAAAIAKDIARRKI